MAKEKTYLTELSHEDIQSMDRDELVRTSIETKMLIDRLNLNIRLMKHRLSVIFKEEDELNFYSDIGNAYVVTSKRKIFDKKLALKYLTPDQLIECYREKEVNFIKLSPTRFKK